METEPQKARTTGDTAATTPRRRPWLLIVFLLLVAALIAWIWGNEAMPRQRRFEATVLVVFVTGLGLFIRLVFFTGLRWRTRLITLGLAAAAVLLLKTLFRIQGVTGDLLPIIVWRFRPPESVAIVTEQLPAKLPGVIKEPVSFVPTAHDFPQFMGPQRNGIVAGPALAQDWQAEPPQLVWRQPVGPAWSGFALVGKAAVTQEQRADQEMVVCYDRSTGQVIWSHADTAHYHTTIAGEGPRATPTIAGDRVYALGATGILSCLELSTGQRLWSRNILTENADKAPEWGVSGSPLVVSNRVIVCAGGSNGRSLVAYDRMTGDRIWGGGNSKAGYSSPLLATLAGAPQVLIFNEEGIMGHDLQTGAPLWSHPWRGGHPHVALPVVLPQDRLLVSSGYGTGSELLEIRREAQSWFAVVRLWKSIRFKAKFNNPVYHEGHVYGLDDGILVCLDLADGGLKWKEGRYGHGQIILAGGLLLVGAEDGRMVLVEATPAAHRELTQFQALNDKTWNPPALAGDILLVRNHKEAACYRLPLVKSPGTPPAVSARR